MTKCHGNCVISQSVCCGWNILTLVARIATCIGRGLTVSNLPVSISSPTICLVIVSNRTCIPATSNKAEGICFKRVVVPFPGDVRSNGRVSGDVGAIDAWCQGPIHVEGERCRCRTARVVGVNRVGCVARHVLRCAPNATVGRSKGKAGWQGRCDFPRCDSTARDCWCNGCQEPIVGDFNRC